MPYVGKTMDRRRNARRRQLSVLAKVGGPGGPMNDAERDQQPGPATQERRRRAMSSETKCLETGVVRGGGLEPPQVALPEPKPGDGTTESLKTSGSASHEGAEVRESGRNGTSGPNCGTSAPTIGLEGRVGIKWLRVLGVASATSVRAMWRRAERSALRWMRAVRQEVTHG